MRHGQCPTIDKTRVGSPMCRPCVFSVSLTMAAVDSSLDSEISSRWKNWMTRRVGVTVHSSIFITSHTLKSPLFRLWRYRVDETTGRQGRASWEQAGAEVRPENLQLGNRLAGGSGKSGRLSLADDGQNPCFPACCGLGSPMDSASHPVAILSLPVL